MKSKKIALSALLIAFAFIGAQIKIMGSIALDSLPAFLGTLLLGPALGAAVAATGHFLTALTAGFPFGLPSHLMIAIMMGLTMIAFYWVYTFIKRRFSQFTAFICAAVVAVLINGPLAVVALFPLLGSAMGSKALFALIPVLSFAATANIVCAIVIYQILPCAVKSQLEVLREKS